MAERNQLDLSTSDDASALPYHGILRAETAHQFRNLARASLLASAMPVSLGAVGGLYAWDVFVQRDWAAGLAALTPAWAGLALWAVTWVRQAGRLALGFTGLGILFAALLTFTSSRLLVSELFTGFVSYVGRQPLPVLAGFCLVATGAELRFRNGTIRAGRVLLLSGASLLALLYLLPQRGKPFAWLFIERVWSVLTLDALTGGTKAMIVAGSMLGWLFDLFPLIVAILAVRAYRTQASADSLVGSVARYGLSGLLLLACYRMWMGGFGLHGILLQVRAALLLAVVVGLGSRALEAVLRHVLEDSLPNWPPPSRWARDSALRESLRTWLARPGNERGPVLPAQGKFHPLLRWLMSRRLDELARQSEAPLPRWPLNPDQADVERALRTLQAGLPAAPEPPNSARWLLERRGRLESTAAAAAVLLCGALWWRFYAPPPELRWEMGAPHATAEALVGQDLPRYVVALSRRNAALQSSRTAGSEDALVMRSAAAELMATARELSPELARHVEHLTRVTTALDLTGHVWSDAVHNVNASLRQLGLPYYLEPNALLRIEDRRERREFYLRTFFVEQVRRFSIGGREYGALHVRRLDRLNVGGTPLGYVRDDEPFAVVALDEIEDHATTRLDALRESGECGLGGWWAGRFAARVDSLCGDVLWDALERSGMGRNTGKYDEQQTWAVEHLINNTERHELQHQVDGLRLPIPAELFELVPVASDTQLERAAKELSAYLCELTSGHPHATLLALADISDFLITESIQQVPERYAAGLIAEALSGRKVILPMGAVANEAVAALWEALADRSPPERATWLKEVSNTAHQRLFGAPCATLP